MPALLPELHGKVLYIDTDCIVQGMFLELSYYVLIRAGGVAGVEAARPILYWVWLGLAVSVELFLFYPKIAPETISGGVKFLVVGGGGGMPQDPPTRCMSHACIFQQHLHCSISQCQELFPKCLSFLQEVFFGGKLD